jgi:hypothetical protein
MQIGNKGDRIVPGNFSNACRRMHHFIHRPVNNAGCQRKKQYGNNKQEDTGNFQEFFHGGDIILYEYKKMPAIDSRNYPPGHL